MTQATTWMSPRSRHLTSPGRGFSVPENIINQPFQLVHLFDNAAETSSS